MAFSLYSQEEYEQQKAASTVKWPTTVYAPTNVKAAEEEPDSRIPPRPVTNAYRTDQYLMPTYAMTNPPVIRDFGYEINRLLGLGYQADRNFTNQFAARMRYAAPTTTDTFRLPVTSGMQAWLPSRGTPTPTIIDPLTGKPVKGVGQESRIPAGPTTGNQAASTSGKGTATSKSYLGVPMNQNFDVRTGKPANATPAPLSPVGTKPATTPGNEGKPLPFKQGGYTIDEIRNANALEGQRGFDWSKARYGTPPSYNQGPYQNNTMPHVAGYYIWGGKYYPIGGVTPGVGIRGMEDGSYRNYWGWWNLQPYMPKQYWNYPSYGGGGGWGGGGGYRYSPYGGGNSYAYGLGNMNWNI